MSTAPGIVEELLLDAGLPDDEALAAFLGELQALGDTAPPQPSAELAALLGGTAVAPATVVPFRTPRRRRRALAAGALAFAAVAGSGIAAAANELPAPAQRLVSQFSHRFLPFRFPAPEEDAPRPAESPAPSDDGSSGAVDVDPPAVLPPASQPVAPTRGATGDPSVAPSSAPSPEATGTDPATPDPSAVPSELPDESTPTPTAPAPSPTDDGSGGQLRGSDGGTASPPPGSSTTPTDAATGSVDPGSVDPASSDPAGSADGGADGGTGTATPGADPTDGLTVTG